MLGLSVSSAIFSIFQPFFPLFIFLEYSHAIHNTSYATATATATAHRTKRVSRYPAPRIEPSPKLEQLSVGRRNLDGNDPKSVG